MNKEEIQEFGFALGEEWKGNNYYVYPIIHRFNTFFVFSIFMLFIFGIAFIFACLAKMLFSYSLDK